MRRDDWQRGITLVELMVALAIAGVLFNLAFNVYLSSWRMYKHGLAATKINIEARSAFRSFARDIESSFAVQSERSFRFHGENKSLRDISGQLIAADFLSVIVPIGESYAIRDSAPSPGTGLMRIDYFLDYDAAAGKGSFRKNIYLFRAGDWVKESSLPLAENVKEVELSYYDGSRWVAEWKGELYPKAVAVDLVFHDRTNALSPMRLSTIVSVAVDGK